MPWATRVQSPKRKLKSKKTATKPRRCKKPRLNRMPRGLRVKNKFGNRWHERPGNWRACSRACQDSFRLLISNSSGRCQKLSRIDIAHYAPEVVRMMKRSIISGLFSNKTKSYLSRSTQELSQNIRYMMIQRIASLSNWSQKIINKSEVIDGK